MDSGATFVLPAHSRRRGGAVVRSFGTGAPLLLLHGGVGSWTHWLRNIGPLAARFRVHAVDLPGFGDAADVPRGLPAEGYVDLVHAALSPLAEEDGPLHIAGFSFGGAVGAALARRLDADCAGFAAIGPGGFGNAPGRSLGLKPAPPADDPAYAAVIRHNLLAMMIASHEAIDDRTVEIQTANIARARFDSRKVSLRATFLDDLAAVAAPVMVIWGDADVVAWPSVADRIAQLRRARPDARVEIIAGAGHWTQYERAGHVNAVLLDFFGSIHRPAHSS